MFFKVLKKYLFGNEQEIADISFRYLTILFVTGICLKIVSGYKLQ
jgi:hypothetical protein